MPPYERRNYHCRSIYDESTIRSSALIAVCHMSCWISSVVLGVVSIWLRGQATAGMENSIFGIVGLGIWGSFPYVLGAIFSMRASKVRTYSSIAWLFGTSIACLMCSLVMLAFSSLVVAIEASIESVPKRVIVAGILAVFSLIEAATSIISCVSCYTSIGCFDRMLAKGGKLSGLPKSSKISPGDEDPSHVTVMALPARQAAELFYRMYRPHFPPSAGFPVGDPSMPTHESGYSEMQEATTVNEQKRWSRHHRRRHLKSEQREVEEEGYPNSNDSPSNADAEDSDEDGNWNAGVNFPRKMASQDLKQVSNKGELTPTIHRKTKKHLANENQASKEDIKQGVQSTHSPDNKKK